jgi:hypothetical protein
MHYEIWFMEPVGDRGWRWPRSHNTVAELAATYVSLERRINAGDLIADVPLTPAEVGGIKFDKTARIKFLLVEDDGTRRNLPAADWAALNAELKRLGRPGLQPPEQTL